MRTIKDYTINIAARIIPFSILKAGLPKKFILYGHLMSDRSHAIGKYYQFPSIQAFESLAGMLRKNGFQFVSLEEYLANDNRKKILLTFDDGYKNILEDTHPYLQKNNIPYIVFIVTGPFENPDFHIKNIDIPPIDLFLTEKEVLILKEKGVHIGFHTQDHIRINHSDSLNDQKVLKQLGIPDQYKHLFSHPLCFSYPYQAPSNYIEFNHYMSKHLGYQFFFDTKGFIEHDKNHFFRVSIDADKNIDSKDWLLFRLKQQLLLRLIKQILKSSK